MDSNEFNFEALFRCAQFIRYTSPAYKKATDVFYDFLKRKFDDFNSYNEFESESNKYCTAAQESGFEQGFCFAVKLMKALERI